jgi:alginate O-acetyltransferase complex protein AlgI
MLFHSPEFMVLVLATLALYLAMPKARLGILAVANAVFYAVSGWEYLILFFAMTALTHYAALQVGKPWARLALWGAIIANLANLFLFKYAGFVATNLARVAKIGIDPHLWQWILPAGISFYTFQHIAYLVDVHNGHSPKAKSLIEFWVFLSFFAHLIAGPIMRGRDFLPQIQTIEERRYSLERFRHGLFLFALGMAKKVLVADLLSPRTDNFFLAWANLSGTEAWIAGWLFAFQIYFDFSAYSEMALGVGYLFDFELTVNFKTPYLSENPTEFWKRWHITLSSWIRDFIYIPLGGSRRGELRAYLNLVIAMALSGLWHGAAWTFIAWGIFHGLLSVGHKLWVRYVVKPLPWWPKNAAMRWLSIFLMFQATTVGWIFFRAAGMTSALTLIKRMFAPQTWHLTPLAAKYLPVILVLAALHVVEWYLRSRGEAIAEGWRRWVPPPVRALVYTAVGALLLIMTNIDQSSFIYFRF